MTVDQWVERCGDVFRRARKLESHLVKLSIVALEEGLEAEARSLLKRSHRVMQLAEEMVNELTDECWRSA